MRVYKMSGYNDDNLIRVRYCFAESYLDAKKKFSNEYWYLKISEITECSESEATVIGATQYGIG